MRKEKDLLVGMPIFKVGEVDFTKPHCCFCLRNFTPKRKNQKYCQICLDKKVPETLSRHKSQRMKKLRESVDNILKSHA